MRTSKNDLKKTTTFGTLSLKIIKANLIKESDFFNQMDPYIVVYNTSTHKQFKTKVIN